MQPFNALDERNEVIVYLFVLSFMHGLFVTHSNVLFGTLICLVHLFIVCLLHVLVGYLFVFYN